MTRDHAADRPRPAPISCGAPSSMHWRSPSYLDGAYKFSRKPTGEHPGHCRIKEIHAAFRTRTW